MRGAGGLLAANVVFAAGLIVHGFLYNFYISGLGFDPRTMGHAQAALIAGGLLAFLPAGRVTDRVGPRATLVLASLVTAGALAAGGLVETRLGLLTTSLLAGVGAAGWRVASGPSLMRLASGGNQARWFGWNTGLLVAAGGTGVLGAGAASDWLAARPGLDALSAYRILLVGSATLTGLASPMFARLTIPPAARADGPPSAMPPMPPRLWFVLAAVAVWWLGHSLAGPFFNVYFRDALAVPVTTIGVLFAVHGWTAAGASVLGGEAASRWGVERPLTTLAALLPISLLGLAVAGSPGPAASWFLVHGLAGPGANPLIDQALFARCRTYQQGTVASWRHLVTDVAGIAGASAGGLAIAAGGFRSMMAGAAGLALLGTVGLSITTARVPVATSPTPSAAGASGSEGTPRA